MTATDRPTGDELMTELRRAAHLARTPLQRFIAPISPPRTDLFLRQIERSSYPLPSTVERVRALIAGQPIPAPHKSNVGTRHNLCRTPTDVRLNGEEIIARQRLTERARAERLPGETLDAAIARLTQGANA